METTYEEIAETRMKEIRRLRQVIRNLEDQDPKTPKILIVISGGNLQEVHANMPIKFVLVDHDSIDAGESPVNQCAPMEQDSICQHFYELFTDATCPVEMEIRDELKRRNL